MRTVDGRLAVHEHLAGRRRLQVGEDAQHGRLAAAARAEQRGERALGRLHVDVLDGLDVVAAEAEALGESADLDPVGGSLGPSLSVVRTVWVGRVTSQLSGP